MSEYNQLINQLTRRRGRPRLTEEERQHSKEERKKRTALRAESRRRAQLVLQHRHAAEYEALCASEYASLEEHIKRTQQNELQQAAQ